MTPITATDRPPRCKDYAILGVFDVTVDEGKHEPRQKGLTELGGEKAYGENLAPPGSRKEC